jgi:hypothetical protein
MSMKVLNITSKQMGENKTYSLLILVQFDAINTAEQVKCPNLASVSSFGEFLFSIAVLANQSVA